MHRLGLTIPLDGQTLAQQRDQLGEVAASGFTDLWSAEASGADAFTPLVAAAVSHPGFRLGTAIVPAYTRSPGLMAMSAAALADVAQNEVVLGIGTSSDVIVEKWNGLTFRAPYQRVAFPPQHSERLRNRAAGNLGVQRQVTATELRLGRSRHLHGRGQRAQCQPDTGSGSSPALLPLLIALSQPDRIPPRPDFLSR